MLSFLKVSQRPTWSVFFIITQRLKLIFKSNQSLFKANLIIYNFHVYTKTKSKQKRTKKTQERETASTATVQLAATSKSTRHGEFPQALVASDSPPARGASCDKSHHSALGKNPIFAPKS